jgi:hypothetical protein
MHLLVFFWFRPRSLMFRLRKHIKKFMQINYKSSEMSQKQKDFIIQQQKKMCRVSARRLSIYNFALGLLKASNLQAESKILKKNIGTPNLSIKTKNF